MCKRGKQMRQLTIRLIRDLGNAVVVQIIDRVEVLPKNAHLYKILTPFILDSKTKSEPDPEAEA